MPLKNSKAIKKPKRKTQKSQTLMQKKSSAQQEPSAQQEQSAQPLKIYNLNRYRCQIFDPNVFQSNLDQLEWLYHLISAITKEKYNFVFSQIKYYLGSHISDENQKILGIIQDITKSKSKVSKDVYLNKKDYVYFLDTYSNGQELIINVMNSTLESLKKYKRFEINVQVEINKFKQIKSNWKEKFQKHLEKKIQMRLEKVNYPEKLDLMSKIIDELDKIRNNLLTYKKNEKLDEISFFIYITYKNLGGTQKLVHNSKESLQQKQKNLNAGIKQKDDGYNLINQSQAKCKEEETQSSGYNLESQKFRQTQEDGNRNNYNTTDDLKNFGPTLRMYDDSQYENHDYRNLVSEFDL